MNERRLIEYENAEKISMEVKLTERRKMEKITKSTEK